MQRQTMEACGRVIASVGGDHGGPFLFISSLLHKSTREEVPTRITGDQTLPADRALEGHLRCVAGLTDGQLQSAS